MLCGELINGYTLCECLGEGGMAEVWRADNGSGQSLAIKLLSEELLRRPDVVQRFKNEAQVMLRLRHPNICAVYEYSEELLGRPAILMEFLEGQDLASLMQSGRRFNDSELILWWNTLVDVLRYTHGCGIVHRDIKPSNIFLTTSGVIKLLDFGVAKLDDSLMLTKTGYTIGTILYMSPEQVRDSKNLGYKTDIYSLAVTFYHLLSGVAPYDFSTDSAFDIQMKICQEPLALDALPRKWQTLLSPFLSKDPEQRPRLKKMRLPKEGGKVKLDISPKEPKQPNKTIEGNSTRKPRFSRNTPDKTQVIRAPKDKKKSKPFDIRSILAAEALACLDRGVCPIDKESPLSHTKYLYVGRHSAMGRNIEADYIPIGDKTYSTLWRRLWIKRVADASKWVIGLFIVWILFLWLFGIAAGIFEFDEDRTISGGLHAINEKLFNFAITSVIVSLIAYVIGVLFEPIEVLARQYAEQVVKSSKGYPNNYIVLTNRVEYIKTTN